MGDESLDLTEDELRALADEGDKEAQEALNELVEQPEVELSDDEAAAEEAIVAQTADALAYGNEPPEVDYDDDEGHGPPEEEALADPPEPYASAELETPGVNLLPPVVYIGDRVRDIASGSIVRVRMTHGRGVVSTRDGRKLRPSEYEVVSS